MKKFELLHKYCGRLNYSLNFNTGYLIPQILKSWRIFQLTQCGVTFSLCGIRMAAQSENKKNQWGPVVSTSSFPLLPSGSTLVSNDVEVRSSPGSAGNADIGHVGLSHYCTPLLQINCRRRCGLRQGGASATAAPLPPNWPWETM